MDLNGEQQMGKSTDIASYLIQAAFTCVFFSFGVVLFGMGSFNQTMMISLVAFTLSTVTCYVAGVKNGLLLTLMRGLLTCGLFSLLLWFSVQAPLQQTMFLSVTAWVCGIVSSNLVKVLLARRQ